ncbi:serine protease [Idiomarina tyrosinivorans]|uniref:Serine protease n=1 Tax=Idiomarina tyrosinivorans TaxID=1445662 RepID=A0A432ZQL9_9GAMM|nr:trypsin-like peptidase domain-containing protein [Idiomarina tyrosinivorans]RUO80204.1 serine protease [Idiomarina tyrosinivorans]
MRWRKLLSFLTQSVGLGLIVAALILWGLPALKNILHESDPDSGQSILSFANAVNRAAPAVVNIYSMGEIQGSYYNPRPSKIWRLGSGVIMDQRGYILTAYHVVVDVDLIEVALQDGRRYGAQLIGSDRYTDIAVLKIDAENLPVIPVNEKRQARVGDIVLAIGNPYNLGQTITQGIISATGGRTGVSNSYSDLIQMDATINEGASGGALVNTAGELVGINNASYSSLTGDGGEGIYFATPYPQAKKIMETIIAKGKVTRGYIGISVDPNYNEQRTQSGLMISGVEPNGPADKAGLRAKDYIVEMNGKPVSTASDGLDLVANSQPGTEIPVVFYRGNHRMQTTVTVTELTRQ